nr:chloride channel protein [Brucepastera parasyntrophica]
MDRQKAFTLQNGYLYLKACAVGISSGLIVTGYRYILNHAGNVTGLVNGLIQTNKLIILPVFLVLTAAALFTGFLTKKYPMIKGSGIPQVKGVLNGNFRFRWLPELIAKFSGGVISLVCGLSLGREGPSIQLGAYAAEGISSISKTENEDKKYLLVSGAAAGLAAAFNAPLAGIIFAFEELRYRMTHIGLVCIMLSCMTAEVVSELLLGQATAFSFRFLNVMPVQWYVSLVPLGLLCGASAALFNKSIMVSLSLHEKIKKEIFRPLPAFMAAGAVLIFFLHFSAEEVCFLKK